MKQSEEKQISDLSLTDHDASLVYDKKGGLMPGYNVQLDMIAKPISIFCPEGKYLFCHQSRGKGLKRYFNRKALCKSECCKLNKLGFKTINRSPYADSIDRNTERIKK